MSISIFRAHAIRGTESMTTRLIETFASLFPVREVTAKGLAELRARMPFADISKFERNPELTAISDLFTVEMITRYIQGKLGHKI